MPIVSKSSKGFTLFELLIVVLLISILYGVFIQKLSSKKKKPEAITLVNLKQYLSTLEFQTKAELVCFEPCSKCYFFIDDEKSKLDAISLFKTSPIVYEKDYFGQLQQKEFIPKIDAKENLHNVCFQYTLRSNGSSSNYIVDNNKEFYVMYPYLDDVNRTQSLSTATELFDRTPLLPREKREYNF